MNKIAIFPGSFDPFTKGHEDIVRRGIKLFDKVIIAIGINTSKKRFFETEIMISKIQECFIDTDKVEVISYLGLTAKYAEKSNATHILRGVRNTTDFNYENTIALANKQLNPVLETIFLITSPEYAHISSTVTRELHKFGEDISAYIPYTL